VGTLTAHSVCTPPSPLGAAPDALCIYDIRPPVRLSVLPSVRLFPLCVNGFAQPFSHLCIFDQRWDYKVLDLLKSSNATFLCSGRRHMELVAVEVYRLEVVYSSLCETHRTVTERHLPYGIAHHPTQVNAHAPCQTDRYSIYQHRIDRRLCWHWRWLYTEIIYLSAERHPFR